LSKKVHFLKRSKELPTYSSSLDNPSMQATFKINQQAFQLNPRRAGHKNKGVLHTPSPSLVLVLA
jgi:hypothetical protein